MPAEFPVIRVSNWSAGLARRFYRERDDMRIIRATKDERVDFQRAREVAVRHAAEHLSDPTTLSWFDWSTGHGFPDYDCCDDTECRPGWVVYGEERGGVVRVDVGEDYSFILCDGVGQ